MNVNLFTILNFSIKQCNSELSLKTYIQKFEDEMVFRSQPRIIIPGKDNTQEIDIICSTLYIAFLSIKTEVTILLNLRCE